ncbi:MAG: sterol desaturase family protein [Deltaproteobacteria bacterium]|nr:sterol desaturase family protein [Deltaproteobacteria bacterium]
MPDSGEASYQLARGAALAAALVLGLALERWKPHARLRPAWRTNFGLWAVDGLVMGVLCGACGWIVGAWAADRGLGLLAWTGAGPWISVGVGIVGLDAVSYLWHRANHQVPLLWRFHQVHHGDRSFHVTTALRFHPGELLLALPVRLAAIVALGVPAAGVLLFELVFGVANLLEHGNFDLPRRSERLVRRLFITPTLHRAHHASDWRELDTNFGTVFSTWDRLGRTFHASEPGRRVVTGLPDWSRREAPALAESLLLPVTRGRSRAH